MCVGRVPITNEGKHASVQKVRYVIHQTYVTYMEMNVEPGRLVCVEVKTFDVRKRGVMWH